jgi:photosystem II stability/assembly factor-like uncharacterized protein
MLVIAMVTPLFSGCFGRGASADPPSNFMATAGDGRVMLTWTLNPGVDYWLFTATDPSLTAFNWTGLPNMHAYPSASMPFYMCGLLVGDQYYFAANGRINGGPGGTSSQTITTTIPPYNASAGTWTASSTPLPSNLYGIGYTSLTTCSNNSTSAAGSFAAVGAGGTILTSNSYDGQNWDPLTWNIPTWNTPTSGPPGFDLYAVTGYTANLNNPTTPGLLWVAVGAGGGSVYSTDSINWYVGRDLANPPNPALRSITQVAGTFFAVGDAGTILSSPDGITWTHRPYNAANATTQNLNGVTHGGIFVAVGDNGTILISSDGNTWTPPTTPPAIPANINLHQVTSFVSIYGTIYVAVGDAGTIVTSIDGGTTWITQTAPTIGSSNLVGITVESRAVDTTTAPPLDSSLGFVSTAQFVAIDSTGNAYTSVNGYIWSAAISTGTTNLNALVSSGFGYVAVGNAGATAYAF